MWFSILLSAFVRVVATSQITHMEGMKSLIKCRQETESRIIRSINCDDQTPDGRCVGKRCPECIAKDLTSKIHMECGMTTSAGVESYYDEEGRSHYHDRNVTRSTWSCTQGHAGKYRSVKGCNVPSCSKQGYTILETDPNEFRAAREERRKKADAEREERRKKEEDERIARGDPPPKPLDTNIGSVTIGTYSDYANNIGVGRYITPYYYPSYYTGVVPGVTLTPAYNPGPTVVSFVVPDNSTTTATNTSTDEIAVRIVYNGKNYVGNVRAEQHVTSQPVPLQPVPSQHTVQDTSTTQNSN